MGVVTRAVFPVRRFVETKFEAVKHIGFGYDVIMLAGKARIARGIRHHYAVDLSQLVGLRLAGLTGAKAPQRKARCTILFVAQPPLLHVLWLAIFQVGSVHHSTGVDDVGEVPSQQHVINAVAVFRIALLNDLQPDQHPADVQRREANLARFVLVVNLLTCDGVIGFIGQFVAE